MGLIDGFEHIVRENESLARFTRLRLPGVAEYFAEPTNLEELEGLVKRFSENELPVRMIGAGSNIVVREEGVAGLVVHLSAPHFCQISVNQNAISCGGGVQLSHFVSTAVREGLSGPENFAGVPGTVGGALHSNADANGVDIGTWTKSATVLTRSGETISRTRSEMNFAYRQSSLSELAIVEARFEFDSEPAEELTRRLQKLWIVQRATQPSYAENSIYVFKDHGGESASKLIEQSALKGTRIGDVQISEKDANYFVAGSNATCNDVIRLIELVQSQVMERLEIDLQPGIRIW